MNDSLKILPARFFRTVSGTEPVRVWLKDLDKDDSRIIGGDIRTVEYGWPIGMPVCRPLKGYRGLWEVRSHISNGRIARVIFHISSGEMILLHGFIKKTQQTPQ
jgi:phage-related protein